MRAVCRDACVDLRKGTVMKVIFYEGQRIYLRPIEVEDEPLFRLWMNDPRNWQPLGRCRPVNKVEETQWLEKSHESDKDVVFGIVVREDDRLIGSAGLHRIDWIARAATLGIVIGDIGYQDQGYGTEAVKLVLDYGFTTLNLHRVQLDVFSHNPRAVRAYEKAGFVFEGRLREAFHRQGRYIDVLRYGILRREWEAAGGDALDCAEAYVGAGERSS